MEQKPKPNFEEISLDKKKIFDEFLSCYPPRISELTFTNLFAWRKSKNYKFAVYDGHLLVSLKDEAGEAMLQPIGPEPHNIIELFAETTRFVRVDKKIAEKLKGRLKITPDRDMFDYVYDVNALKTLAGDKYNAKRNLINRFEKQEPVVLVINQEIIQECLNLEKIWCDLKNCSQDLNLISESGAIRETLENFTSLKVMGVAIKINDHIEGFAIGEQLNKETFVEHFEKANPKYTGIYQFLLMEFAKSIPQGILYINREQDLGVEGLRKAKLSYHPVFFIEKVDVSY
ncbi:MAG: phosphatidylglycerol lysyltransferase domain-containing protein [Candidatus Woesearchaeota archaeon]